LTAHTYLDAVGEDPKVLRAELDAREGRDAVELGVDLGEQVVAADGESSLDRNVVVIEWGLQGGKVSTIERCPR
jgi:hypothetical protein